MLNCVVANRLGEAGLKGWRARVADAVAGPVARNSRFDVEQVRNLVGLLFLVLAITYVVSAARQVARR